MIERRSRWSGLRPAELTVDKVTVRGVVYHLVK